MAIDLKLIDKLLADYKKPEDILGENGLLKQLTKALLERAMQAEMTEHLGYEKHDPAGHNSGKLAQWRDDQDAEGRFRRDAAGDATRSQRQLRTEDHRQEPGHVSPASTTRSSRCTHGA